MKWGRAKEDRKVIGKGSRKKMIKRMRIPDKCRMSERRKKIKEKQRKVGQ